MTARQAIAFVKKHGIVLQSARGPAPSLAEAIAEGPIRGSWWGHPKGQAIFQVTEAVAESPDVLVCKLIGGHVTYVHRRLWPALVRLQSRFPKAQLARTWSEHSPTGAHRSRRIPFPGWVPSDVAEAGASLTIAAADDLLSPFAEATRMARRTQEVP